MLRADALDTRWGPPGSAERRALDTLYLGGGTPSLLPATAISRLVAIVRERFGLAARRGGDARGQSRAEMSAATRRRFAMQA